MIERCLGQHCCKTWHRLGQRWVTVTVIAFLVSGSTQPESSTPLSQSVGHFAWTVSSISVVGDSNVHISILDQTESQKTKKRNLVLRLFTILATTLKKSKKCMEIYKNTIQESCDNENVSEKVEVSFQEISSSC